MRMDNIVASFYDSLSADYHLIFADWKKSIAYQGETLDKLIKSQTVKADNLSLLDCSCGIGTQAIGLALKGYNVHATDISSASVQRAQIEAKDFNVSIKFGIADFRFLNKQVDGRFDVVLSCDNSLPHLLTEEYLTMAINNMKEKLRSDGLLLISIRDYDAILLERPVGDLPRVFDSSEGRRIVFQIWDWEEDKRTYLLHHFIIRQMNNKWETIHNQTRYRALQRNELTNILEKSGFIDIKWHMPEQSGYYQPIVTATKN